MSSLRDSLPRNTMSLSSMTWGARTLALVGYAAEEGKPDRGDSSEFSHGKTENHWFLGGA
jgi:hypothetical protein